MAYERKTTLVAIYKDAHAALRVVAGFTGRPMTKLIDDLVVEQFEEIVKDPTTNSHLLAVAQDFLMGRA